MEIAVGPRTAAGESDFRMRQCNQLESIVAERTDQCFVVTSSRFIRCGQITASAVSTAITVLRHIAVTMIVLFTAASIVCGSDVDSWYFPPAGEELSNWQQREPSEVGLDPALLNQLRGKASRWALWRHGYLIHVEGAWNQKQDVASLRKTWHALTVGAAIQQGRIPSLQQKINIWETDLTGRDADATWWHVITQSTGFDFPHQDHPRVGDPRPGTVWTYSDKNPVRLCNALAKVYGKKDYRDHYREVLRAAYFDAIGMRGWEVRAVDDGIRLLLDLEDMGRLGLLVLARGRWKDKQLIPQWFVKELETKQTRGMAPIYNGPDDGNVGDGWWHQRRDRFPECPYGYMTWVNSDAKLFPGADHGWAYGAGRGGSRIYWNYRHGIVLAGVGMAEQPTANGIPHIVEEHLVGLNPLGPKTVGQWGQFETMVAATKSYVDPYRDVTLNATLIRPDGRRIDCWGFYDADQTWRIRFMPDDTGTWSYRLEFSDGSQWREGSFECISSDLPGMISADLANPWWFGFRGGDHVMIRGLHVGDRFFARNWPDPQRQAFLDWAQEQRYNLLSVASHYLNRQEAGRGRGWDTPKLWPLDAKEYQGMERILDELVHRRLLVFPFAGFFGKDSNFPREPDDQELYLRYTLARLGAYVNLLFNVAGPEPNLKRSWMASDEVVRLGKMIRRWDVFAHPLSVHNRTGDDPYRDSIWTTYGVLQGPKTIDRPRLAQGLLDNHHAAKPLLAQETLWSGNKNHPDYTDSDLRKNAFVINMCATAFCFADNRGNSSTGFSGTMDLSDCRQRRHDIVKQVWDFFETVDFWQMTPRPDLVDVGFCLADPGRQYLVYLDSRGTVNVRIEGGPFNVEWIKAQDTSDRRPASATSDGRSLASPSDGDDWLVHLYH